MRREQGTLHGTALAFLVSLSVAVVGCSLTTGDGLVQAGDVVQVQADSGTQQAADALDSDLDEPCVLPPGCVDPNGDGDLRDGIGEIANSFRASVHWKKFNPNYGNEPDYVKYDLWENGNLDGPLTCRHLVDAYALHGRTQWSNVPWNTGYVWWKEHVVSSLDGIQCMPNLKTIEDAAFPIPVDAKPVKPLLDSLAGLEVLKSLKSLTLNRHHVSTLEPIQALEKLESVDLANQTGPALHLSLSPLTKLLKLTYLRLQNYTVPSLDPLAQLVDLKALTLEGYFRYTLNQTYDHAEREKCALACSGVAPTLSLEPLTNMLHLSTLYVPCQRVDSLVQLSKLAKLVFLDLCVLGDAAWPVTLAPLSDLPELSWLALRVVGQLDGAVALAPLSKLDLTGIELTVLGKVNGPLALDWLSGMKGLRAIEIHGAQVESFAPLQEMELLHRVVTTGGGPVDGDLSPLFACIWSSGYGECDYMYWIEVDVAGIVDLSGIENLGGLEMLLLPNADIVDMQPLIDMKWDCEKDGQGSYSYDTLQIRSAPAEQLEAFEKAHPCVALTVAGP